MNIENTTARIEELTDLAMSGRDGLERVEASLGPLTISSFSRADIMRGIAEQVLPKSWEWDVLEAVNGECFVCVKRTG